MGNIVLVVILFFMANLIGVTVFSYYAKLRCDPVFSGMLNSPNKVTHIKTSTKSKITMATLGGRGIRSIMQFRCIWQNDIIIVRLYYS